MIFKNLWKRVAILGLMATVLVGSMATPALAAAGTSDESAERQKTKEATITLEVSTSLTVKGDLHPETPAPFTFTMTPNPLDKDEPLPMAIDEETGEEEEQEPPARITIHGEGTGAFDITFTEPGTYTYLIDQEDGEHEGYTYDQSQYLVTVRVSYDRNGNLQNYMTIQEAGNTEAKVGEVVFYNEYEGTPIVETEEPTPSPEPTETETPVVTETPATESPAEESPAVETPVTSTSPTTPTPTQISTTHKQVTTKTGTTTPKTGDETNIFRWVVVLAVMLMGAVTCVWYLVVTKKHSKNKK
jgi:pilin isopeptide linkage protein